MSRRTLYIHLRKCQLIATNEQPINNFTKQNYNFESKMNDGENNELGEKNIEV